MSLFVVPHDTPVDIPESGSHETLRDDTLASLARAIAARARDTVRSEAVDVLSEDPIAWLKAKLEAARYSEDAPRAVLDARKTQLMELADHMPYIAERLLFRFRVLALEAGADPGTVALHIVGGRIRGNPPKPFSDNSDFDLIITAENPLLTDKDVFVRKSGEANIALLPRIRIFKALYAELPAIFAERGLEFEPWLLEFKNFANHTAAEHAANPEAVDATLKISESPA